MEHNISLMFDQLNSQNFDTWPKDIYTIKKEQGKLKASIHYGFAKSVGTLCRVRAALGEKF